MERNALAYTVGITVDLEDDGQRVRTRPVRVEVRAYVDEDEARRSELMVGFTEADDRPSALDPSALSVLTGRDRGRVLDDVRQSKIGRRLWSRRGRVQFMVLGDEPCWIPDLRLAMLVALHNARSDDYDLDPHAIWFGGIPLDEIGRSREPVVAAARPYTAHAVNLARSLSVDAWGPNGPLVDPVGPPEEVLMPRPLPVSFAVSALARVATRSPLFVLPGQVEVVTAWARWLQARNPTLAKNPESRRAAVQALSSRRAVLGPVSLPSSWSLADLESPASPAPVDTFEIAASFGVVSGTLTRALPVSSRLPNPSDPIVVAAVTSSGLADTYDSDDAWVVPTDATVDRLHRLVEAGLEVGRAGEVFESIRRTLHVVQD